MSEKTLARIDTWLAQPLEADVAAAIARLRRVEDVRRVAVMPDVHLASDVCVGTVIATSRLLFPAAVGGDIGCGMLAIAFDADATALRDPTRAAALLRGIAGAVPPMRRHRRRAIPYPRQLHEMELSHDALGSLREGEASLQLGTLGGGNHFVELQVDDDQRLWLMVHSGSRAMGQAVRAHHLARALRADGGMLALDGCSPHGSDYLCDVCWARAYADANRRAIADSVADVLKQIIGIKPIEDSLITCDHNHVQQEVHEGESLWVHRKGAMSAPLGANGVLPGSMGTLSYHVEGRGRAAAMNSSAHGAGRALSRNAARSRFSSRDLLRQMQGIWFDHRFADSLRDGAPGAYKNVGAVLRAQRDLVRVTRTLKPLLVYKAG